MDPLTVTELSNLVKATLRSNRQLMEMAVRGEVTNYSAKKHHYFNIKDENASVKCVIWASRSNGIRCLPLEDGQEVTVWGSVTTYPAGSTYQIDVLRCEPQGKGDLFKRYLELKRRLFDEGLFDPARKKPLPIYPERIGIVTSEKGGAVLQDMVRVFMQGPGIEIVIKDARVQGEGSAESIIAGIKALDGKVDVIIIARGGGSTEDLWSFNDEALARAVSACRTPTISAVGHEVDDVITDHVADARASTPTAAAELIVKAMQSALEARQRFMESMRNSANDRLRLWRQTLDIMESGTWGRLLTARIGAERSKLRNLGTGNEYAASRAISSHKNALSSQDTRLRTTWVAAMAENGLAAICQGGARVRSARELSKGDFQMIMKDGKAVGEVKDIEI